MSQTVKTYKPVVTATFKDPLLGIRYTYQGGVSGNPKIKIQGTLETVEINLVGVCQPAIESGFDLAQKAKDNITKVQNIKNVL